MPESFDLSELTLPADSEFARLLQRCPDIRPIRYDEGEFLVREGELTMETYIVIEGGYVVERRAPGGNGDKDQFIHSGIVTPDNPCFVGEMAYLGGSFRTASIRSSGQSFTLRLEAAHLEIIIDEFPSICKSLCRQLISRIVEANKSIGFYQDLMKIEAEQMILEDGQTLIEKGAKADNLHQLIRGNLSHETENGEESFPRERLRGGFLELETFLRGGTWSETVKAKGDVAVVAIPLAGRDNFIRNHPSLILKTLS